MFRATRILGVTGGMAATAAAIAPQREREQVAPVNAPQRAQWRASPSVAQAEEVNPMIYAAGAAAVGVGLYLFGGASSGGADATTTESPEAAATFKKAVTRGKAGDIQGSTKLLKEAAEMGSTAAMVEYGLCLAYGKGTDQDESAAIGYYKKAAAAGDPYALTILGISYDMGNGVEKDPELSLKYFTDAAAMDEPEACYYLAWIYIYGDENIKTARDPTKGLELLKKSADLGHAPAIEKYPLVAAEIQNE